MQLARILSLLVLAVCAPSTFAQSPDTAASATHDLGVRLRPDQPLLAELRLELRGTLEASADGKAKKLEFRHETRLDFVDQLVARDQPEPGDLDVRRTYLLWEEDGAEGRAKPKPRDNAFGGTSVLVTRRKDEIALELIDRLAPKKELEMLLKHSESVTWLALPASVRVGEAFEAAPAGLVNLLLDEGFTIQGARVTFTLRAVDAQGLATLDGPLVVMVQDEDGTRGTFEGACAVVLDTRAQLVQSIEWKGKALMRMDEGEMRGEMKATFESRLSVQAGEVARAALARRITYRSVPRELTKGPVKLELPSHWYAVEAEEGEEAQETFRTAVHGAEALVTLELSFFDLSGEAFDAVVDGAVSTIEKDFRLNGMRNVPSPFGKGRSVRFQTKNDDGSPHSVAIEFYPCGKTRLMRVGLGGAPDAFDEEFREWQKTLRTFELTQ